MSTEAAIEVEGIVKHFGDVRALDGVDLRAQAGRVLGLLGPNGAGKTTLVRVLATLIEPDAGTRARDRPGRRGRRGAACASGSAWPGSTRPSTKTSPGSRT